MKAVHFGAGNIGLGFIGLLLSQSGYDVRFVDIDAERVALLNERGSYRVRLADDKAETTVVENVSAIDGRDARQVARAVADADLVTTAVGPKALAFIAESIAGGIELRLAEQAHTGTDRPLVVVACENALGATSELKKHVFAHLSPDARARTDGAVFFPDAAVDRIVPLQQHEDKLHVTVEPFYEWVIDRSALPETYPPIAGVHYVDRLEPYIERKLFTVNTGHCCAAYHGYWKGYATIQEAMRDDSVAARVRGAMDETGAVLVRRHGFDAAEHRRYVDRIVERFRNPHLTDEVVRVGRSPLRKLAPNDRLVRPARLARELGLASAHLTEAIAAALKFDYAEDAEAVELQRSIRERGLSGTLARYLGVPADDPLHDAIAAAYRAMEQGGDRR